MRGTRRDLGQNPWLDTVPPTLPDPVDGPSWEGPTRPTGAVAPQPGSVVPNHRHSLEVFVPGLGQGARVWVAGVHGGAGESTVARLVGGEATARRWPDCPAGALLLTARTHAGGLAALQTATTEWAAGQYPEAQLLGVVFVADAPGKLPTPLAELVTLLAGGVPHVWTLPWHEGLRLGDTDVSLGRRWRRSVHEITTLATTTPSEVPA